MAENTLPLFADAGKFYVYVYRDPRPRKKLAPIYVGKGTAAQARADVHWNKGAANIILARILDKIRRSGLEPVIEIVAWYDDENMALSCERSLIAKYGRRNIRNGSLCNLTDGGEGVSGLKHSKETRARLSQISKEIMPGIMADPIIRKRLSDAMKARMSNKSLREKVSLEQTKRMEDPMRRAAISAAMTRIMSNPGERAKRRDAMKIICADSAYKARRSEISKEIGAREEVKVKRGAAIAESWNDPKVRDRRSSGIKAALALPEEKARRAEIMRERMADPAYRQKIQNGISAAKLSRRAMAESGLAPRGGHMLQNLGEEYEPGGNLNRLFDKSKAENDRDQTGRAAGGARSGEAGSKGRAAERLEKA